VDTHLDVHVAAAVDPVGGLLGVESFPTTPAGYHDLSGWLSSFGSVERVGSCSIRPVSRKRFGWSRRLIGHVGPPRAGMHDRARLLPMSAGRRVASIVVGATVTMPGFFALALPATAHPSPFETLTLDFLIGPKGLEIIDAAVVESSGPSYQPFPTSEFKRDVAVDVLNALHLSVSGVEIDAEMSVRYHEVGFLVRFYEPSLAATAPLSLNTAGLQEIVADRGLSHLRLSVCGVADGSDSPDQATFAGLDIQASQDSRLPAGPGRATACEVWALDPTDKPVSIVIKPQQVTLPTATTASTTTTTSDDTQSDDDGSPDSAAAQSGDEDGDGFPVGIVAIAVVPIGLAATGVVWYLRSRRARAAT
jgi:hypothetical protein